MYNMYTSNIILQADGLPYPELNELRAFMMHPIFLVVLGCNMLLEYDPVGIRPWSIFAHVVGFLANLLRIVLSILFFLLELLILPVRIILGAMLTPAAFAFSLGHIYALPCAILHAALLGSGGTVLRLVTLAKCSDPDFYVHVRNAGALGRVLCFRMSNARHASYLAASFNIRQRAGFGPEVLWVRGQSVFVADWTIFSLSNIWSCWLRKLNSKVWATWKLLDLKTMEWRRVVITADMDFQDRFRDTLSRYSTWRELFSMSSTPAEDSEGTGLCPTSIRVRKLRLEQEQYCFGELYISRSTKNHMVVDVESGERCTHRENPAGAPQVALFRTSNPIEERNGEMPITEQNGSSFVEEHIEQSSRRGGEKRVPPILNPVEHDVGITVDHQLSSQKKPTTLLPTVEGNTRTSTYSLINGEQTPKPDPDAADEKREIGYTERTFAVPFLELCGSEEMILSMEHLDVLNTLEDLDNLYRSPLGWNKYHLMRAMDHQIKLVRYDRRLFGHLMAIISSIFIYVQFRDGSVDNLLHISVDVYALIVANYALLTAYAAEVLTGPVTDVTEVKSERYGVIATRAIDRGYVRGFHVPNGEWLRYENGLETLPIHVVRRSEVNLTCNSVVRDGIDGPKIRIIGYESQQGHRRDSRHAGYSVEEMDWIDHGD